MAGTAGIQNALCIHFLQDSAGADTNDYALTRTGFVLDAWNLAHANQVGGTVQLFRQALGSGAFNAATDAMNAGVAGAVTHAGFISDQQNYFVTSDVLRFTTVGTATLVDAMALFVPFPLADQRSI